MVTFSENGGGRLPIIHHPRDIIMRVMSTSMTFNQVFQHRSVPGGCGKQ